MRPPADESELLAQARARADKLLADLLRQQADLSMKMPSAEAGLAALQNAIDAVHRTAFELDRAAEGKSES